MPGSLAQSSFGPVNAGLAGGVEVAAHTAEITGYVQPILRISNLATAGRQTLTLATIVVVGTSEHPAHRGSRIKAAAADTRAYLASPPLFVTVGDQLKVRVASSAPADTAVAGIVRFVDAGNPISPVETDAASRAASRADVSQLATHASVVALGSPAQPGDPMGLTMATRAVLVDAVWAAGTRTLTGLGSLATDVAAAVWSTATRTLSAFGFAVETDAASRAASRADVSALARSAEVNALLLPIGLAGAAAADAQAAAESADAKLDGVAERTDRLPDEPASAADVASRASQASVDGLAGSTPTGPRTLTIVATADGQPAASVPVYVVRAGSYYATLTTDAQGRAEVPAEDGVYRLAVTAAGYAALVQDATINGADAIATLELANLAVPVAPPGRSAGTLRIFDAAGEPAAESPLHLRLKTVATDDHGLNVFKATPLIVTTDATGAAALTLLRGATYELYRRLNGPTAELVVPEGPTFTAPDLVL